MSKKLLKRPKIMGVNSNQSIESGHRIASSGHTQSIDSSDDGIGFLNDSRLINSAREPRGDAILFSDFNRSVQLNHLSQCGGESREFISQDHSFETMLPLTKHQLNIKKNLTQRQQRFS